MCIRDRPTVYTLSGTFLAGGTPQTGGTVYAFDAATSSYVGYAGVNGFGNYAFTNLAPGSYKLYLSPVSAGYGLQWYGGADFGSATTIVVSANTTQNIVLYTLSGSFTAGGTPQTGGYVYAFDSSGTYVGSALVNGSGNYAFNLASGSYKLYLSPVSAGYGLQWYGGGGFA